MDDGLEDVRKILAEAGIETDERGVPVWQDQPGAAGTDALPAGPDGLASDIEGAMQAYPYQPDPQVEAALKLTTELLADSRALLEDAQDGRIDGVHGPVGTGAFAATSSSVDATAEMCNTITGRALDVAEGKYSLDELDKMNADTARMITSLEGFNATEKIYDSIADHQREWRDQDMAHHHRTMESDARIEAEDALDRAADRIDDGLDATSDLDWARHEIDRADYHDEQADYYDDK